jgi:Glyoxalase-like domain
MVADPARAARRLEDDGWVLDAGQAHRGQGTRNRRLAWPEQFFELVWVTDQAEARANPLRLDRRAHLDHHRRQPVRSRVPGPGRRGAQRRVLAVRRARTAHLDSSRQRASARTASGLRAPSRRRRDGAAPATGLDGRGRRPGDLREIRVRGPSAPSVPSFSGPPIVHVRGRASARVGRRRPRCLSAGQRRLDHPRVARDARLSLSHATGPSGHGVAPAARTCAVHRQHERRVLGSRRSRNLVAGGSPRASRQRPGTLTSLL